MKPDEKETLRKLFRLDVAVNDLREEGKYPFTDDRVALEINEDDLGSFCEKIESTDDYTVSEWHKLFVEEGYAYSTVAPEPEFSLSTLWGIISKVFLWYDYELEDLPFFKHWYKTYKKNEGKLLSELDDLNDNKKVDLCAYLEITSKERELSAEEIKAFNRFIDELCESGVYWAKDRKDLFRGETIK